LEETKTPPEGGVLFVLGGPGRNRTTDTRIFNPRKSAFSDIQPDIDLKKNTV